MNKKFKIDFIGIGVERAGTTWLFECLKEHPQICCSKYKEVKFFSKKTQFGGKDDKYSRGLKYYQSYFKHCQPNQIKGEFSPHYLYEKESAQRIKKNFPKTKLIVCLRNPIERAYSLYWFEKTRSKITQQTFEQAINNQFSYFIKEGFYSKYLKDYFDLFPTKNIFICIYEDSLKNPIKFIQKIYNFLEVDENLIPNKANQRINTPHNKNKFQLFISFLILKIKRALTKFSLGRNLINWLEQKGTSNLIYKITETNKKQSANNRPKMNPRTRKMLQKKYQTEIKKIEKLINRNLFFWK